MKYVLLAVLCMGLVMSLSLTGCSVEPSKIDGDHAIKMATELTYFKDSRTGLCFATIASRKTGTANQSGLGLTCVPCEKLTRVKVY